MNSRKNSLKRIKKLPSYKVKSKTSIQKKNWPKKKWSKVLAKVCWKKKKRSKLLRINWLPCAWSMKINYKKLFLILKKNAIRSKISSFYKKKKTNFLLLR